MGCGLIFTDLKKRTPDVFRRIDAAVSISVCAQQRSSTARRRTSIKQHRHRSHQHEFGGFLIIRSEAFICRKKEKPQKALGIGSPALCGFPTVMTNVADCGVPYGIRPS